MTRRTNFINELMFYSLLLWGKTICNNVDRMLVTVQQHLKNISPVLNLIFSVCLQRANNFSCPQLHLNSSTYIICTQVVQAYSIIITFSNIGCVRSRFTVIHSSSPWPHGIVKCASDSYFRILVESRCFTTL